jgi:hypothetical protein
MNVKFRTNLGSIDASAINLKYGADVDYRECTVDAVVNVTEGAAKVLVERGIAEPVSIRGEAKKPEITAPAKQQTGRPVNEK